MTTTRPRPARPARSTSPAVPPASLAGEEITLVAEPAPKRGSAGRRGAAPSGAAQPAGQAGAERPLPPMAEALVQGLTTGGGAADRATRALFARSRHGGDSATLCHLPFLFWLIEVLRPARLVQAGLGDPARYLALCQAMDRLDAGGTCLLLGAEALLAAGENPALRDHDALYGEFSTLIAGGSSAEAGWMLGEGIDLLVLEDPQHAEALLARLSPRAVVVLSGAALAADLLQSPGLKGRPVIGFGPGRSGLGEMPPLVAVLAGEAPAERLLRLAAARPGSADHRLIHQTFARLGQGLMAEASLREGAAQRRELEEGLRRAEQHLAESAARLSQTEAALAPLQSVTEELAQTRRRLQAAEAEAARRAEAASQEAAERRSRQELEAALAEAGARAALAETEAGRLRQQLEAAETRARDLWRRADAAEAALAAAPSVAPSSADPDLVAELAAELAALRDRLQQRETALAALERARDRDRQRLRDQQRRRLQLWEEHEALRSAHAALLATPPAAAPDLSPAAGERD